ncbi:MAG: ATP-binding protein [Microbacterium gubbeenense]|uniref:ATP-binding protein n=1 Tax=Microbacterium gubbeenense TaxID=159896 RepID=UPI000402CED2|nr:ATP-binding protein [Microbacterium gubbeenense]
MNASSLVERLVFPRLIEALADTRIVVLQGARQVGKSTLSRQALIDRPGLSVTLDDPPSLDFARADPTGFVEQAPDRLLIIDELQRAPELVIALKAAVDRDHRPGRFLVTGSANLLELSSTHESLAGRAQHISLHPFSQREIESVPESFVDLAFSEGALSTHHSALTREDYVERACAGGYPEALGRQSAQRRQDWYEAYVSQIVRRDAVDISGLQRMSDLPRLLRLIAARMGSTMVWSALATDAGMPRRTLDPYAALLETLFLTHTLPAWAVNLTSREVKQPKIFPVDSGLAAALLGAVPEGLGPTTPLTGALLECFVVGELRRQQTWASTRTTLHHYRDSRGVEVDAILETPDGRVVGIEVKSAATVRSKDAAGLGMLRDQLGDRFIAGYVLHTGSETRAVGERISAVPMDALWAAHT